MTDRKVAVLTGAGRVKGIGAATAKILAKRGYSLLLNFVKNREQAENIAKECRELGVDVVLHQGDLTDPETCQNLAEIVQQRWGRLDRLVNCLGKGKMVPFHKLDALSPGDFQEVFAVNVIAPFLIVRALKPLLEASQDPAVVNISSNAGLSGRGSSIAYCAAKGAENTLTLSLAATLAPKIRVNAICPGLVDSSWWEEAYAGKPAEYDAFVESYRQTTLLNRALTPEDVAEMIVSMLDNPAMTGEIIRLANGSHLSGPHVGKR